MSINAYGVVSGETSGVGVGSSVGVGEAEGDGEGDEMGVGDGIVGCGLADGAEMGDPGITTSFIITWVAIGVFCSVCLSCALRLRRFKTTTVTRTGIDKNAEMNSRYRFLSGNVLYHD